ncbi:hypothetical protein KR018_001395 [Drosophila ironensis]|nr:hypothetical protein KR018_001395 [Drosophila ironensis]
MDCYEIALGKVVNRLVEEKGAQIKDKVVMSYLIEKLAKNIRTLAVQTCNGAYLAGRSVPTYFDLERAFILLDIDLAKLRAVKSSSYLRPAVNFTVPKTRDEDYHKVPQAMLNHTTQREMSHIPHIPDYLPPYPGTHTFRATWMELCPEKNYLNTRERLSTNRLNLEKALNSYYLGLGPKCSLFLAPQPDDQFELVKVTEPKRPAYMDALMPRDHFLGNYGESKEETNAALNSPFLMEPKLERSLQLDLDNVDVGPMVVNCESQDAVEVAGTDEEDSE